MNESIMLCFIMEKLCSIFAWPCRHAALLVLHSDTIYFVVDCHEYTETENAPCESRPGHL